jgi:nitrate/nitrite transporter NarK
MRPFEVWAVGERSGWVKDTVRAIQGNAWSTAGSEFPLGRERIARLSADDILASHTAAAATFGLINSIGQLGGFAGNYAIGFLNDRTHSLAASFAFIALVYLAAGGLVLSLRARNRIGVLQRPN